MANRPSIPSSAGRVNAKRAIRRNGGPSLTVHRGSSPPARAVRGSLYATKRSTL